MRALAMLERLAGHVTDGAVGAQLAEALMPLLVAKTTRCGEQSARKSPIPKLGQKNLRLVALTCADQYAHPNDHYVWQA